MKLLIISDVHKEDLWSKLFAYIKKHSKSMDVDIIIFNGDIFGEFERIMSHIKPYVTERGPALLKLCAPKSSKTIIKLSKKIAGGKWLNDTEMKELGLAIADYIKERYKLAVKKLEKLCTFGLPVWYNLGNHEAPTMSFGMLLAELADLTKLDFDLFIKTLAYLSEQDRQALEQVFQDFMKDIRGLEKKKKFRYIGDRIFKANKALHIGLSGITIGYASDDIFEKAKKQIKSKEDIIIYRHKQAPAPEKTYERFKRPHKPLWHFIKKYESTGTMVFLINSHHHCGATPEYAKKYGSIFAHHKSFYFFRNAAAIRGKISILDTDKKEVTEIDFLKDTTRKMPLIKLADLK